MREYDQAVGRLISCCSAQNARYNSKWTEQGQQHITIAHRGFTLTAIADPTQSSFELISVHRLSNIEAFDITNSTPIVDLDIDVNEWIPDCRPANLSVTSVAEMHEESQLEYFDGLQVSTPLFVYDDEFGPKEFDRTACGLGQSASLLFNRTIDEIGIDLDDIDEAAGEEGQDTALGGERAFQ